MAVIFFRSYSGLPDLMYHLTFITQTRYTGAIFNEIEFYNRTSLVNLMWVNETSQQKFRCEGNTFGFGCRLVHTENVIITIGESSFYFNLPI